MSIALSEFWTRLVRVGITDSDGCKELASGYRRAQGTPPSDAKNLAKYLIQSSVLTKFQARTLLASEPGELRIGDWLVTNDRAPDPFGRWRWVQSVKDGRTGILLRATPEALSGGRDLWLEAHRQVTASTLQNFEWEQDASSTVIFSPLPAGRVLWEAARDQTMSPIEVIDVGVALARALQAMHARPLIHGGLRLDRVWVTPDGTVTLLRDPAGPPLSPWEDPASCWLDTLDDPTCYVAPEFIDRSRPCDIGTDIYSLGCSLFRLITGRSAITASTVDDAVTRHATETPPELAEAVEKGESGDPLFRVLAYAMAKNPEARFASAEQLATALEATRSLVPDSPSPVASDREPAPKPPQVASQPTKASPQTPASVSRSMPTKEETRKARPREDKSAVPPASKTSASKAPAEKTRPERPVADASPGKAEPKKTGSSSSPPGPQRKRPEGQQRKRPDTRSDGLAKRSASPPTSKPPVVAPTDSGGETPAPPPKPEESSSDSEVPSESIITAPTLDVSADPVPKVKSDEDAKSGAETSTDETASRRRRKKKDRKAPIVLGGMCVAVLILLIGLLVPRSNEIAEEPRQRPRIPENIPSVTNQSEEEIEPVIDDTVAGYQLVSDDRLLYVPPYAADAATPPLQLLPPGPAIIVTCRVDSVLSGEPGQSLIDALTPDLQNLMQMAATMSKIPLEQMSRCTAALHPGTAGWPEVSLSIELTEPQPRDELIDLWQVAASRTTTGAVIYAGDSVDSVAYYLPNNAESDGSDVSRFAVGSIQRISEVADAEGGAIPLARSMERLWGAASSEAELVALVTPNFLFADGREMLSSSLPELVDPLKAALIPDTAAAMFTVDIDRDHYYIEARVSPSGGVSEAALLRRLQTTVEAWPPWAEEFIVTSVPDASWRLLATRLPAMMRFISEQFRYGISDGVVIANTYLPVEAVPQVTVAVALAMNTSGQVATVAQVDSEIKLSVEEMLDREMTVSFDQESLEFAVDAIVDAFRDDLPRGSTMPPIRIIGADLELGGITQNQQVRDFSKSGVPLRRVLTDLVVGANPDKSATGPGDPKQALIWVVHNDESGNPEILITTRAVAVDKYELPIEFEISDGN